MGFRERDQQATAISGRRRTGVVPHRRAGDELVSQGLVVGAVPPSAARAQVLGLQRAAGNLAVQRLLHGTVQRADEREADVPGAVLDSVGTGLGVMGQGADAANLPKWNDPSATALPGSGGVSAAAGVGQFAGGAVSLGFAAAEHHKARRDRRDALIGTADHREADRRYKSSAVNVAGGTVGTATGGVSTGAAITGLAVTAGSAAATTATTVGGAAGIAAVPLSAFMMVREGRRAIKAQGRINALQKAVGGWDDPKKALKAKQGLVQAWREYVDSSAADVQAATTPVEKQVAQQYLVTAQEGLRAAQKEQADLEAQKAAMEAAVKNASTADPTTLTADIIAAYALKKNTRGSIKKWFGAISGALGVGGGLALGIAAIAGTAALMASPVGWALAAGAAAIGIGVGIYKLVKWIRKRGTPDKRKVYAERLLDLASQAQDPKEQAKAIKILEALGLADLHTMQGSRSSKVDLVKAKLAS